MSPRVGLRASRKDLRLTEELYGTFDKEKIDRFHRIASGKEPAAVEGGAALERLQKNNPELAVQGEAGNSVKSYRRQSNA